MDSSTPAIASSRIFIKGLPPSISEDEFKKHFGTKYTITDAKLISSRRIGYVGYKTPEEATKAVKYFNKTFIRMSKIGVEIARPISDSNLPVSRKAQREQERENVAARKQEKADAAAAAALNAGTKRKRDDLDESDPKLKEFMDIMQPASKPKTWKTQTEDEEPPTKMQAIEVPEGESDGEYEVVPKKARKRSPPPPAEVPLEVPLPATAVEPERTKEDIPEATAPTTDEDWLRSRTNRLLDLVDPDEIGVATTVDPVQAQPAIVVESTAEETVSQEGPPAEAEAEEEAKQEDPTIEAIKATGRLFVRNLPYSATEDDLKEHFSAFGFLDEVHLPVDAAGTSKGFVLVQYSDPIAAAEAFHNLDGEPFQGRLLHIIPASAKRENKLDEFAIAKLPLKKQKQVKKKMEATSAFNWNSLFMNQDAVNEAVAHRLGVSKSEMLDPTSADSGYKQAIAETSAIQESKSYFSKNGVDLDAFKRKERGDTAILVKNFPYGMSLEELRKMFEPFGQVLRALMPPIGTIAIVEFAEPSHARAAFASLAYRRFQDSVLFLEKAPKNIFTTPSSNVTIVPSDREVGKSGKEKLSASDLLEKESAVETLDTSTLFVNNLNFTTTSDILTETFQPLDGFISARVKTKTDPKKPGQVLSMGFGFLEFRSKAQAQAALATMDGHFLEGHKLTIKASHKGLDAAEEKRKEDNAKKQAGKRTKIIIKNLPFQATKQDVRALFGTYGQLRSVRVPKKFDHTTRGFAFANFITAREAENALEALKDTHLLGRRLVIEFAADDAVDAEEEIAKMEKRTGAQVNKVAVHKLTGGSRNRKKFDIEGDEEMD
ncbi:probable multiple RNA-binding domain-containing protein 1 [Rhynchosporium agropyri]|uniref:Multiple RNA-binding domain-containing protein 1 n=1 Tax=Rhynchosporium agropyri TaxID=914238 RepID=A0A1E1KM63_9HELO|nr:probable multiple RNA-binding domain-containing protein 1 [Rhynchosporium agropyri]